MAEAPGDERPPVRDQPAPQEVTALQTDTVSEGSLAPSDSESDQAPEQERVPKDADETATSKLSKPKNPGAVTQPIPPAGQEQQYYLPHRQFERLCRIHC